MPPSFLGEDTETVDKFKLELDRYLEVMEIEGYGDVEKTFR